MQPNIFDYATSELSQDAFICYLLAFGKEEYKNSAEYVQAHAFLELCGISSTETIEDVKRQYKNIDVLVVTGKYFLIIEDKTGTNEHNDQILNYVSKLQNEAKEQEKIIKVCYLKTMDYVRSYVSKSETLLPQKNCCSLKREDICALLAKNPNPNLIFKSFYDRLISIGERCSVGDDGDIFTWNKEKWFKYLCQKLDGRNFDIGWVNNARGGFYACWFDWYDIGQGEDYKQIEISFENEKTSAVRLCRKFSSESKEITLKERPLIKELQGKITDNNYTFSNRIGRTTTYAFKIAKNKENVVSFIDEPLERCLLR